MQSNVPKIGVLAGMGPRSTAPFIDLLVAECQRQYGARHDAEFPPMLIYSLPTPFDLHRPLDHTTLAGVIEEGLRHLESTGVAFIAMPCNTAHCYHQQLQDAVSVPLLDMVAEAATALPPGARKIALLATRATIEGELYQRALTSRDCECYHTEHLQACVDAVICAIKSGSHVEARARWDAIGDLLRSVPVDAVLTACTELNVVLARGSSPITVIDATQRLAARAIRTWRYLARREQLPA